MATDMNDDEIKEEYKKLMGEDPKFTVGIDPATEDGDESVITINVTKNRESESDQFRWVDGFKWNVGNIARWKKAAEDAEAADSEVEVVCGQYGS